MTVKLFVSLVSYNSEKTLNKCLDSLFASCGTDLTVFLLDNNSSDTSSDILYGYRNSSKVILSERNLGFCGGHNEGVTEFLKSDCDALCFLNPDVVLLPETLSLLMRELFMDATVSAITPKLLRCDDEMVPFSTSVIDAAGMVLENSLRHFDRGSGEIDSGQFSEKEIVFGGTGALLVLKKEAVQKLLLPRFEDESIEKVYPHIARSDRMQLFDEAFFAYREDADLSYRMKRFGLSTVYCPCAVAYHQRRVTPEKRTELPPELNCLSVKNRFLLQINNFSLKNDGIIKFICGIVLRNIVVCVGVLLTERSSLKAIKDLWILLPRALKIRSYIHEVSTR